MNIQITRLKREARQYLAQYRAIADEADCGHQILQTVSLRASVLASRFNETMEQLAKIDPETPSYRL